MSKTLKRSKCFISLFIMTVMILSMSIPVMCAQAGSISDIDNHWAKKEISAWVEQGFIKGYPDNTFKPNNTITRAEFISLVNRLFAFNDKGEVTFSDVKEGDWFYGDFAKAGKAGYLSGYEGKVVPDGAITRQEVATIAAKVKSLTEDAAEANSFADAAAISAANKGFIGAVTKAKIMNGYPDGKFEPSKSITRAESVIVLNRLLSLKDTVKIEAIKDKTSTVGYTTTVVVKTLTTDAKVTAKSSDENVVQVTSNGLQVYLKGISVGSATVTVTGKKDGMLDGVVTFKVDVVKASGSTGGGGGGGGSSSGGGNNGGNPPVVVEDDSKLTEVKAVVGTSTTVTGKYGTGVTKVEVSCNGTKVPAALTNGSFQCAITPGLAIGTEITVEGYAGSQWVDTDKTTVIEDDSKLTEVQAVGTLATQISGNYAAGVTKVEVICNGETLAAELKNDGTFFQNVYPGMDNGTQVTVKGYAGTLLLDTDVVKVGDTVEKTYINNIKSAGTMATQVTGNYYNGVTKVEVICGNDTFTAELKNDGTFFQNIYPGLEAGTTVTVKAYIGTQLVATKTYVTEGEVVEKTYIDNIKASGTMATQVTGNYYNGVTKVEVICNGETLTAELKNDGTFFQNIYPGLEAGTTVTVKAYIEDQVVATNIFVTAGGPVEGPMISDVKAISGGTVFTVVEGKYATGVTKVEVVYTNKTNTTITKTAQLKSNGEFSYEIIPGLAVGATVTVTPFVGDTAKDPVAVNVQ